MKNTLTKTELTRLRYLYRHNPEAASTYRAGLRQSSTAAERAYTLVALTEEVNEIKGNVAYARGR